MSRNISLALPIVSALIVAGGAATAASAQTVPPPGDQERAAVREILNRAETESRRRSLGEIIGGIAGVSQAAAQTSPPARSAAPAPAGQPATVAIGVPAASSQPVAVAQAGPPAQATARTSTRPSSTPPAAAPVAGSGTPSDPSMIATVPPAVSGSDTAPAQQGRATTSAASQPVGGNDAAAASRPSAAEVDAPRTVIADAGSRHRELRFHRPGDFAHGPDWCPPPQW